MTYTNPFIGVLQFSEELNQLHVPNIETGKLYLIFTKMPDGTWSLRTTAKKYIDAQKAKYTDERIYRTDNIKEYIRKRTSEVMKRSPDIINLRNDIKSIRHDTEIDAETREALIKDKEHQLDAMIGARIPKFVNIPDIILKQIDIWDKHNFGHNFK